MLDECAVKGMGDKTAIRKALEELLKGEGVQEIPEARKERLMLKTGRL